MNGQKESHWNKCIEHDGESMQFHTVYSEMVTYNESEKEISHLAFVNQETSFHLQYTPKTTLV